MESLEQYRKSHNCSKPEVTAGAIFMSRGDEYAAKIIIKKKGGRGEGIVLK
jgi:hypothetical protein